MSRLLPCPLWLQAHAAGPDLLGRNNVPTFTAVANSSRRTIAQPAALFQSKVRRCPACLLNQSSMAICNPTYCKQYQAPNSRAEALANNKKCICVRRWADNTTVLQLHRAPAGFIRAPCPLERPTWFQHSTQLFPRL